ncbi:MAG: energy-coupling factor transporter ATPase [Erysipelotrichaceae bacterium]
MSIIYEKLSHTYSPNSPFEYRALIDINLELEEGNIYAVIGETGSGKSTLVQHLNALLLPTAGTLTVGEKVIKSGEKPKNLKALRKQVGLVFQFPEYQLFEETIIKDVSFGPKNFKVPEAEAIEQAAQALRVVGIDDSYFERSPFDLSGGQKRRVAIAGILAMNPDVLVLDEPTAGLDPQGAKEMMQLFVRLNKEYNKTIIIVTHDMEHVLDYCQDVIVVNEGRIVKQSDVTSFFQDLSILEELKINPPHVIQMREALKQRGFQLDDTIITLDALVTAVANEVKS